MVDDKPENLFVLEKILSPLNVNLFKANSGDEALEIALKKDFILVLLDVQMPIMDGYEVLEMMRIEKRLRQVPVIFLTAYYTDDEHRMKSYELGAFDYLYKPFDDRILLSKVKVFIELDKQRKEKQLLEQRYELILDSAGEGIFGLDPNGIINFVNPAAAALLGYNNHALTGKSLGEIIAVAEAQKKYDWYKTTIYQISTAGYFHRVNDAVFIKQDGSHLIADYVITSIRGENSQYLGVVVVFSDAGLRLKNEETQRQLLQAQRMESIGQLTGGIAHDFNNLLMTIQGNIELLSLDLGDNTEQTKRVAVALSAIDKGATLTKRLLAFARKQTLFPKRINVHDCMVNVKSMLTPALGETIKISTEAADDLWSIWIDEGQLENALVNLAVNARDAMPNGGELSIEAQNVKIDETIAFDKYQITPGEYVKISITDQGTGIAPEIQEHIFEPFFTTKGEGKGTGLGLSMIYGFIKQSKGHITVYSEMGHGTTFHLYLPKAPEDVPLKHPEKHADNVAAHINGDEIILLVEDETTVREVGYEYLTQLGYKVLVAENGVAALKILQENKDIALLFTDVIMPEKMTGPELAIEARKLCPTIKILFTSGYPKTALANNGKLDFAEQHLAKPYKLMQLAQVIRELLDK